MPTYTYACKDCGERVDVVRSFSEGPLTACPTCGGAVRQVFKPAGIVFKGSGWHIKDYADGGTPSSGSTSSDGGSSSPSDSSGTSGSSDSSSTSGSSGSSTPAGTSSSSAD